MSAAQAQGAVGAEDFDLIFDTMERAISEVFNVSHKGISVDKGIVKDSVIKGDKLIHVDIPTIDIRYRNVTVEVSYRIDEDKYYVTTAVLGPDSYLKFDIKVSDSDLRTALKKFKEKASESFIAYANYLLTYSKLIANSAIESKDFIAIITAMITIGPYFIPIVENMKDILFVIGSLSARRKLKAIMEDIYELDDNLLWLRESLWPNQGFTIP